MQTSDLRGLASRSPTRNRKSSTSRGARLAGLARGSKGIKLRRHEARVLMNECESAVLPTHTADGMRT